MKRCTPVVFRPKVGFVIENVNEDPRLRYAAMRRRRDVHRKRRVEIVYVFQVKKVGDGPSWLEL
jgi:hypothetical protein